ncbi:MAG: hypothetical protein OXH70_07840 [Acidobacteria bacterium]|nr:hypothetical protein [Acidobacteriota bacterium]
MIPKTTRGRIAILALGCLLAALPAAAFLNMGGATELTQILNVAENALVAIEQAAAVVELKDQIDQQLDDAMGKIGALTQAFEDLSSDPMSLLQDSSGLSWAGDFTGEPLALANAMADMQDDGGNSLLTHSRQALAAADTVSRQRYARAYRDVPTASDNWLERRERAERQLATDYFVLDSAEALIELLGKTSASVERSRQQTELADTALAQEAHAMKLNDIEVDIAVAQLTAHHAARNMLETWKLEEEHREQLEAEVTAERAEARRADRAQNRVRGQRNAWRQAFLFN